jgi:hypothetical protein
MGQASTAVWSSPGPVLNLRVFSKAFSPSRTLCPFVDSAPLFAFIRVHSRLFDIFICVNLRSSAVEVFYSVNSRGRLKISMSPSVALLPPSRLFAVPLFG